MTITSITDRIDEAAEEAVSAFNAGPGFYGYDAEIARDHRGNREIVVRYDGETLVTFNEAHDDWLEDLASYGWKLEGGAAAA